MSKDPGNILMITSRADFGGGPQHLFLLIKYLKYQVNIFVACPDDFPYKKRYELLIGTDKICIIPHRKFTLKSLFELKSFVGNKRINLIHSHGKGAGIYGRFLSLLAGRPAIHTFHGLHIDNYNSIAKIFYLTIEKILSLFTKKLICVSKSEYSMVVSNKIAPPTKLVIINNGVEINNTPIEEIILTNHEKKILHVSRFDFAKNSLLLIPILEDLKEKEKNFKLIVIGSGEEENEFKERIRKRNLDEFVEMKGTTVNLQDYLKDSFCFISTSRWEGLPLGLMEAMSCGIPVVASNVPGNNDLVEHNRTGFLFNIQNPHEAVEYLLQLFNNISLWRSFALASAEKIRKNFSASQMSEKTKNLYNEILQESL